MRAPVAPNGWPIAIEPPITLSLARSTSPTGCEKPARSAHSRDSKPRRFDKHLRRERLVHLDEIDVLEREAGALERDRRGEHRALSSCSPGSSAAYAYDRMNASGW